jgi:RNA 3'-terminal phosphate cyclase (ATP)
VQTLIQEFAWDDSCAVTEEVDAHGPGNVTFIELASRHVTEVFTGFGRLGVKAEHVADEVS